MSNFPAIMLAALLVILVGCSSNDEDPADQSNEQQLYHAAQKASDVNNFSRAIELYQALEARYPFGKYATQAQIELVYAYYRDFDLAATRSAADRFIRLHPDDVNVDYAYYLEGLASFTEDKGILDRFLPTDLSKRDPGKARDSFAEFSQLVSRYPQSPYAADARARMLYLKNLLAANEIHVAEYYIRRGAYVAALNRGRYIVENFQQTPSVPDGMAIMVECYLRLGLNDLADTSLSILKHNYPEHPSLDANGKFLITTESNRSLLYTASFGLFDKDKAKAPLAPTQRPIRPAQENFEPKKNAGRSWLNIISFGLFG